MVFPPEDLLVAIIVIPLHRFCNSHDDKWPFAEVHVCEKRLLALCSLTHRNFAKFQPRKDKATVDACSVYVLCTRSKSALALCDADLEGMLI